MLQLRLVVPMKRMQVLYRNRKEFYYQRAGQVKGKKSMKAQVKRASKKK